LLDNIIITYLFSNVLATSPSSVFYFIKPVTCWYSWDIYLRCSTMYQTGWWNKTLMNAL